MSVIAPALVGMADIQVVGKDGLLTCVGLGSCIGLCAYDPGASVAGIVHVMLPEAFDLQNVEKVGKFANTGVPELFKMMTLRGAAARRIQVAIVGGAQVFKFGTPGSAPKMDIGQRNIEAVRAEVKKAGVRLVAEDVGGSLGRTVSLDGATGQVRVRTVSKAEVLLCCLRG